MKTTEVASQKKTKKIMGKAHVVAVPYPAQGHVIPMMELAQYLANNGIRVTFINTESNHDRVLKALPQTENLHELINLVSVSDGLESWEDRMDFAKSLTHHRVML